MIRVCIKDIRGLPDPLDDAKSMYGLPDTRRDKILRFKQPADRKRSLAAGMLVRDELSRVGRSASEVTIDSGGRACMEGMDYNISHSGDLAVIAVLTDSYNERIGCDIECIRSRNTDVAKRYFTDAERDRMDGGDRELEFYRIWTARESYCKLTGEGILLDFGQYETRPIDGGEDYAHELVGWSGDIDRECFLGISTIIRENEPTGRKVYEWLLDDDYVLAVCV